MIPISGRIALRLAALLAMTGILLPPYLLAFAFGRKARRSIAVTWFMGARALCRLDVRVSGEATAAGPAFFAANHASYLDVVVLGPLLDATFVSKAEVAGWPLFGQLAQLAGTVFISRRRSATAAQKALLSERLARGESLIVFPEGTSTDGSKVLPFRSALFDVCGDRERLAVQPVTLSYTASGDGTRFTDEARARYTWFGDMEFLPHLLGVFAAGGAVVEVVFHPPVAARAFADRKALAAHCQAVVANGLADSLSGRRRGLPRWPGTDPLPLPESTVFSIG